jgi:hypothetical protein
VDFSNGVIKDGSISVDGPLTVGHASDGNMASISFTPASPLPSPGRIELTTPTWTYNFDIGLGEFVTEYSMGDPNFSCESPSLTGLDTSGSSEGTLSLAYESFTGSASDPVLIECNYWRNPIVPGEYAGFYIRTFATYDTHEEIRDKSDEITLDATNLLPDSIDDAMISYSLDRPIPGETSAYAIEFESDILIESIGYCHVKYTFPKELDVSELDLAGIKGSDMLVDETGSIRMFDLSVVKNNFDNETEEEKWIALPGCEFNPMDRTEAELVNFRQNWFSAIFY